MYTRVQIDFELYYARKISLNIMNYEKIVQFVLVASGLGLLKFWISNELDVEFFLVIIGIDAVILFIVWIVFKIDESYKLKKRFELLDTQRKEEEEALDEELKGESIPESMMIIIDNFSLEMPKSKELGVEMISNFLIKQICIRSNKNDAKTNESSLYDKGCFFFTIYGQLSSRFRTKKNNDYDFFEDFLTKESSSLAPGIFMANIVKTSQSIYLPAIISFIENPNEEAIDDLTELFNSFERITYD